LQGLIGYVQYATDLPVALVAAHLLGATSLVVAVTAVVVALTGTPASRALTPSAQMTATPDDERDDGHEWRSAARFGPS
jgi:cytochrome c oxidase assembly protein subunit 15